jgi:hypothetical protein
MTVLKGTGIALAKVPFPIALLGVRGIHGMSEHEQYSAARSVQFQFDYADSRLSSGPSPASGSFAASSAPQFGEAHGL